MQQDHGAGMGMLQNVFQRGGGVGLLVVIPIAIGEAPENRPITELFCPCKIFLAKAPLRRPIIVCHRNADRGAILSERVQLRGKRLCVLAFCHVFVICRVVADGMAALRHFLQQRRIGFCKMRKHEKCAGHSLRIQRIHHLFHIPVFIARVEGEI